MTQWQEDLHSRIAEAIRAARASDGRSAQWLADRTQALGYPVTRAAIANYESGRKKGLDVAELIVISAALDVPPIALLYPALPDGPVESLPGTTIPSHVAAEWFSGEIEMINTDRYPPAKAAQLVRAARRRGETLRTVEHLRRLQERISGPEVADSPSVQRARGDIARLESQIRAAGGVIKDA